MEIYKWGLFIFLILFLSLNFVSANDDVDLSFDVNETYLDDIVVNESFQDLDDDSFNDNDESSFNRSCDIGFGDLNSTRGDGSVQSNIGTVITATSLTKYFGESATLYAYLKNSNGNPLSGKTLIFKINGVSYSRTTNSNGRAGLGINLYPNTYPCKISFSASGYTSSSKTVTVTVNTAPTTLNSTGLVKMYGEAATWYAYLYDRNNNPLSGKNLAFTIHGVTYNRTTDSNGCAGLEINLYPENYTAVVSVVQRGYASSSKIVNIQVNPIPVSFEVNNLVKYYGETGFLKAYLKDNNSNPLMGKTVTFSINGINYNNTTDADGCAVLPINLYPKNYTANVTLNYKPYGSPKRTVNVIVKPIPVNLIAYNQTCARSGSISVFIKNRFNEGIRGKSVVFNIANANHTYVSDASGKIFVPMNYPVGEYDISIHFNENYHESASENIHVSVLNNNFPTINATGGGYNLSDLVIGVNLNNAQYFNYSWDNSNWTYSNSSQSFILKNGVYDFYFKGNNNVLFHEHYIIDNKSPIVWSNYVSDLYDEPILVNISSWDNVDGNPQIYYTLDGSNPQENGIIYQNPISINKTTTLKFYSKDYISHASDIAVCNYIFSNVGNVNTGKGYNNIQSAIDDITTTDGDTILIKAGYFTENIMLNKSLNLISGNATITEYISSVPVICINALGSGSLIYGFNFINSTQAISINGSSNVSIINNTFCNIFNSIGTTLDNNTIIADNTIKDTLLYADHVGIDANNSKNLLILNNTVSLYVSSGYAIRITNNSENVFIKSNVLTNKKPHKGYGIYIKSNKITVDSNHVDNFIRGIYVSAKHSIIYNNTITNNNRGITIVKSINNTYKSNNIYNNRYYGVYLGASLTSYNDLFCLNRLCDNGQYELYSNASCNYVVDDNWWGENPPKISASANVFANIYNGTGNIILNSWIVMKLSACSYDINDNASIESAKFYVDMTYNNLDECLSYKGFIPDNLEVLIVCFNSNMDYMYNISYLKDGLGFVSFELSDLFNNEDFIYVYGSIDYSNLTYTFNKRATIDIAVSSSAWDMDMNYFVKYYTNVDFVNDTYWITVSWSETGLYTGVIDIIVNGEIIESINISNYFYQYLKNSHSDDFFEAVKFYNEVFASIRQGVWLPNNNYFSFANYYNLDIQNPNLVSEAVLSFIQFFYNLTDDEIDFIRTYHGLFVDFVEISIDYHGDRAPNVNFDYDGEYRYLSLPSEYAHRISNIYYSDIEDEFGVSIGYEGMRSFAITRSNLTNDSLAYWLSQKALYAPGLMKASYGTFLTAFLVIWENDRVADDAAGRFNVTWRRTSPVCVSLCNDYNCLYITGDSDHMMGREAIGNVSSVWKFNFATSFSFSLIEQLVGNNVWNDTTVGSVTLGLLESYLKNETLEIFTSNGYVFIKRVNDNSTLLFLDTRTGVVRDVFSYYGLLGTMPCYHDNVTERAWGYGNSLLNQSSNENHDLMNISTASTNNLILNEFTEILAYLFQNIDSIEFIDNLIIGILGSEIVSISMVVLSVTAFSTNPELFVLAFSMFIFGEYLIAYSDGIHDNPNIADIIFFFGDSASAILIPFGGGGLKVGSQTLKIIIEKNLLRINNYIVSEVSVKVNLEIVEWGLGRIIFENIFNKPVNRYIHDFMINDLCVSCLHEVFSNICDYYFAEG
ncbi:chitobiase/beta-hexosaminidase C-terminal domain-containing protein [Methanobrevibacter sp.]|uniref:chitobiase/beta-hexosaminidase C-terminal domain-containing protein n=1 Tax=Methanobrevibacter sp. TaxID=66852 RepID=UPI0038910A74